jgi:hypothetical protein
MTVRNFLEHISKAKQLPQGDVFCFSGREYPLLFFYYVVAFLKKNRTVVETVNCTDVDVVSIKSLLSMMSFSGAVTYYLENFVGLPVKKQQDMLEYLRSYPGPHRIMFFSDNTAGELAATQSTHVIPLAQEFAPRDYYMIRFLVNNASLSDKSAFASELVMRTDQLSLDKACFFAQYELLLGKSSQEFFSQWMLHLTEPTHSLFTLSQHFFSKKNRAFFRQWAQMSELYFSPFWVSFWADQLWRAYVYVELMQQQKLLEAKKAQYKLPFSFINRDWSAYSLNELRDAHHCLATLDFQLKNGSSDIGLEYFYTQFFDNKFLLNQN